MLSLVLFALLGADPYTRYADGKGTPYVVYHYTWDAATRKWLKQYDLAPAAPDAKATNYVPLPSRYGSYVDVNPSHTYAIIYESPARDETQVSLGATLPHVDRYTGCLSFRDKLNAQVVVSPGARWNLRQEVTSSVGDDATSAYVKQSELIAAQEKILELTRKVKDLEEKNLQLHKNVILMATPRLLVH